ncbi:hypothetical protein LBMAG26_05410 [Bacteroidota bacterium]|nr:hypothetical protein LBMAG26_05410 [Bacteroidota bacterium]
MRAGFQRLVILLLVLNLIVISAFWMLGGGRVLGNGNRDGRGAGPRNEIIDRLHFDATQVTQYDSLIVIHRKMVGEKESEIQELRTALFVGVADGISEGRKDSLVNQIGVLQADIQRIHFAHFLDIQRICKPAQQSDFALLTKDLAKMFRGRGPKGKPDRGPKSEAP